MDKQKHRLNKKYNALMSLILYKTKMYGNKDTQDSYDFILGLQDYWKRGKYYFYIEIMIAVITL